MSKDAEISNGMRIGIDARLWNQTGVGRYIRNIVLNLQKIDKKNSYVLFIIKKDEAEIRKEIKNHNWKIVIADFRWHSISEQFKFPRLLNKEKLDIMHFTYQQSVPILYRKPFVMTIHDLIKHHFITGRSSTNPYWLLGFKMLAYKTLINIAARNAKKIIAVSRSTKEEIADHLIANKSNVEVVYEAADDFIYKTDLKIEAKNYFLFVGNVYPHKNTDKMIKAFKKISEKKDIEMVFIGNEDYFYKRLKNDLSGLIQKGKIIIDYGSSDKKLSAYYRNAICLIRPSLMEGFSLPPLEAMACDCLVLGSDIPVHKEIFGESIIYFNPLDAVDIEAKMNYVLDLDKNTREKFIKRGKEISREFSWEKSARQTLNIYESSILQVS